MSPGAYVLLVPIWGHHLAALAIRKVVVRRQDTSN